MPDKLIYATLPHAALVRESFQGGVRTMYERARPRSSLALVVQWIEQLRPKEKI